MMTLVLTADKINLKSWILTSKCILDMVIRRKYQAVTLTAKTALKVCDNTIHVDPHNLFHRLMTIVQNHPDTLPSLFKHDLTNIPRSLFDF